MERAPCNQAELEKLITEKNGVGSKKSRLEGTRICFLGVDISQSLSNYAVENSTRHIDFLQEFIFSYIVKRLIFFKNTGYVRKALEEWLPSQEEFDQFASRLSEKRSAQTVSAFDNSGGKTKKPR